MGRSGANPHRDPCSLPLRQISGGLWVGRLGTVTFNAPSLSDIFQNDALRWLG